MGMAYRWLKIKEQLHVVWQSKTVCLLVRLRDSVGQIFSWQIVKMLTIQHLHYLSISPTESSESSSGTGHIHANSTHLWAYWYWVPTVPLSISLPVILNTGFLICHDMLKHDQPTRIISSSFSWWECSHCTVTMNTSVECVCCREI